MSRDDTKLAHFLRWLAEMGSVTQQQITEAGWKSTFTGQTRMRLIQGGCVNVERIPNGARMRGQHSTICTYSIGVAPYTPSTGGRKAGYRMTDDAKRMMQIRSAKTVLRKFGYMVVPPASVPHG
jgi:hypothetical protein